MADEKRWLSTAEACELLGVHASTLKRWVQRKWIRKAKAPALLDTPGSRRRAAVRYDKQDIERFLEKRLGAKR